MKKFFKIQNQKIGEKYPTFIIAEIGQTHQGSLNQAIKLIKLAKTNGADAVKFQTHYANEESTLEDRFRIKNKNNKNSRLVYWKKMEFTLKEWKKLKKTADKNKIIFLSSPFSEKAVDVLSKIKVPAYKIASGEINNYLMLEKIIKLKKPIILSCGMSNISEISSILKYLKKKINKICLLQCTSSYPTKPKDLGLGMINYFKKKYNIPVGFSDHSGNLNTALSSVALNADILEVHVVHSAKTKGFDTSSSITFKDLKELTKFRNFFFSFKNSVVNKEINNQLKNMRSLFFKSLCLKSDQNKGYIIKEYSLTLKKPGKGIPLKYIKKIVGKKLRNNKSSSNLLKWSDFE